MSLPNIPKKNRSAKNGCRPKTARARWKLTAGRINKNAAADLDLLTLLDRIEKEIPKAKPEVRWTKNNTLAAIGIHHPKLRKRAIAIGEKIGLPPALKSCAS